MYTLPVILFCAGTILGGLHGYFGGTTVFDIFFSVAVGGFLGSTLGAAAFTYMYMAQQREETREMRLASELPLQPRKALLQHPLRPEKRPPPPLDGFSHPQQVPPVDALQ